MKLRKLLYLASVLLPLASCDMVEFNRYEDITPGTIKVDVSTIESGKNGVTRAVTLTSPVSWTAEIIGEDASGWVSVSPTSGSGDANLTVTVSPFAPKDLGRSATVKFTSADGSFAGISVSQAWAEPKSSFTYHKATGIVSGRSYLIVASGNLAAKPLSGAYGYLYTDQLTFDEDGSVTLPNKSLGWTFTAVDGGYTILGSDGRYIYQTGTYDSFNASANRIAGDIFTVEANPDGYFIITNVAVNKFLQYSTTYSSYGSYSAAQDDRLLPVLYEEEVDPDAAILLADENSITVGSDDRTARFSITSGAEWTVDCDAPWITSYTRNGSGNGEIEVEFSGNTDFNLDREAVIKVYGSGLTLELTVVQEKAVAGLAVSSAAVSAPAGTTRAEFDIVSNVDWTVTGPSDITIVPESGSGNATVVMYFLSNREKYDLVSEIKVATTSELIEEKELTVTLTRKTAFAKKLPYEESFASDQGDFSIEDVALPTGSTYVWKHSGNANYGMKASSYFSGSAHASESWLVSPNLDLNDASTATVRFSICAANGVNGQYDDACYGLVIEGDRTTRIDLGFGASYKGGYAWLDKAIDLTPFVGKTVKFAIVYKSTTANCPTVEVKKFSVDTDATFAAIISAGAGNYVSKNALVVAVGSTNTVLYDGTAYMFAYDRNKVSAVGDLMDLDGATTIYNGCPEWNNPAFTKVSSGNAVTHPEAEALDAAAFDAYAAAPSVKYVKVTGNKAGYYVTVADGKRVNVYSNTTIPDGDVEVYGYTIGYHSNNKYILLVATSFNEISGGDEPEPVSGPAYRKVTSAPSDWSGTYLLVAENASKAFSGFSTTSTVYGLGADVTISSGAIAADETVDAYKIVIAPASVTSGAYTIKFGDLYFSWSAGNSLVSAAEESANANWNITFVTDHSEIRNATDATRHLQWNANSPRFACYGNDGQTVIQLYKYSEE